MHESEGSSMQNFYAFQQGVASFNSAVCIMTAILRYLCSQLQTICCNSANLCLLRVASFSFDSQSRQNLTRIFFLWFLSSLLELSGLTKVRKEF